MEIWQAAETAKHLANPSGPTSLLLLAIRDLERDRLNLSAIDDPWEPLERAIKNWEDGLLTTRLTDMISEVEQFFRKVEELFEVEELDLPEEFDEDSGGDGDGSDDAESDDERGKKNRRTHGNPEADRSRFDQTRSSRQRGNFDRVVSSLTRAGPLPFSPTHLPCVSEVFKPLALSLRVRVFPSVPSRSSHSTLSLQMSVQPRDPADPGSPPPPLLSPTSLYESDGARLAIHEAGLSFDPFGTGFLKLLHRNSIRSHNSGDFHHPGLFAASDVRELGIHRSDQGLSFDFLFAGVVGVFRPRTDNRLTTIRGHILAHFIPAEHDDGSFQRYEPPDPDDVADLYLYTYEGGDEFEEKRKLAPLLEECTDPEYSPFAVSKAAAPPNLQPFASELTVPYCQPDFVPPDIDITVPPRHPFSIITHTPFEQSRGGEWVLGPQPRREDLPSYIGYDSTRTPSPLYSDPEDIIRTPYTTRMESLPGTGHSIKFIYEPKTMGLLGIASSPISPVVVPPSAPSLSNDSLSKSSHPLPTVRLAVFRPEPLAPNVDVPGAEINGFASKSIHVDFVPEPIDPPPILSHEFLEELNHRLKDAAVLRLEHNVLQAQANNLCRRLKAHRIDCNSKRSTLEDRVIVLEDAESECEQNRNEMEAVRDDYERMADRMEHLSIRVDDCHNECLADVHRLPVNTKAHLQQKVRDCLDHISHYPAYIRRKVLRVLSKLSPEVEWYRAGNEIVPDPAISHLLPSLPPDDSTSSLPSLEEFLDITYSPVLHPVFADDSSVSPSPNLLSDTTVVNSPVRPYPTPDPEEVEDQFTNIDFEVRGRSRDGPSKRKLDERAEYEAWHKRRAPPISESLPCPPVLSIPQLAVVA